MTIKLFKTKNLPYTILGGNLARSYQKGVIVSHRFLGQTQFEKDKLERNDLALKNWEDGSATYRVKIMLGKYVIVTTTDYVIQFNELLAEHRAKQKRGELENKGLDPKGSRIDLVKL